MSVPLKILLIEDSKDDIALLTHVLEQAGYTLCLRVVETEHEFVDALSAQPWDVVLSDHSLPQFDGFSALELLQASGQDIPFILVSSAVGEECAVEFIKRGAADYLMKDRLARLGTAIEQARDQQRLLAENRRAIENLRIAEQEYRIQAQTNASVLDALPAQVALLDENGVIMSVNQAWKQSAIANGFGASHFGVGLNYLEVCEGSPDGSAAESLSVGQGIRAVLTGELPVYVVEYPCHSPEKKRWFRLLVSHLPHLDIYRAIVMHIDITDHKQAAEALAESERQYRMMFEHNPNPMWVYDRETLQYLSVNERAVSDYGYSREEFLAMTILDIRPPEAHEAVRESVRTHKDSDTWTHYKKNGDAIDVEVTTSDIVYQGRNARLTLITNVTERLRAETALKRQFARLQALHTIDMAITSSTDRNLTLKLVLQNALSALEVDAAAILLSDTYTHILECVEYAGFRGSGPQGMSERLGQGLAGPIALEHKPVAYADLSTVSLSPERRALITREEFVSYWGIPLLAKGTIVGVLEIYHRAAFEPDADWLGFLEALGTQTAIAIDDAALFEKLQYSNLELGLAYDDTIEMLGRILDLRNQEEEGHSRGVAEIALEIARALDVPPEHLKFLRWGGILHDIGTMYVPDAILRKMEPLTQEERLVMQKHPEHAFNMLSEIAFLRPALAIPYCHHEKWDGTGYPRGLKGEQIPLSARIFAVAHIWDALRSESPDQDAWSVEDICAYIAGLAGTHFDPVVVAAFLELDLTFFV